MGTWEDLDFLELPERKDEAEDDLEDGRELPDELEADEWGMLPAQDMPSFGNLRPSTNFYFWGQDQEQEKEQNHT
ncbi:hypothetical protein CBS470a_006531 [Colletotrichum nupharicola]|nr:hypothetical protein CBS470a_006531 [Colletotrichum nupharicola]